MRSCVWLSRCCPFFGHSSLLNNFSLIIEVFLFWPWSLVRWIFVDESLLVASVDMSADTSAYISVDCQGTFRPTIGRQSTDYRSIVDRYLTDTWLVLHWQLIATYRPMHRPSVGRYIGRLSVDCRLICRPRPPIVLMIRIVLQKLPLFSKHSNIRSRTVKPRGKVVSIVWIWRYHGGTTEKSRKHYLQFTGDRRR